MLDVADIWAARTGEDVRLVSANDHVHARRSAHYAGHAVDLHSSANDRLAALMRGLGYSVLWNVRGHFGHVHVEAPGAVVATRTVPLRRDAAARAGTAPRPALD